MRRDAGERSVVFLKKNMSSTSNGELGPRVLEFILWRLVSVCLATPDFRQWPLDNSMNVISKGINRTSRCMRETAEEI